MTINYTDTFTKRADSIVDSDDDDMTVGSQYTSVVRVSGSEFEVVAVYKNHNRKQILHSLVAGCTKQKKLNCRTFYYSMHHTLN